MTDKKYDIKLTDGTAETVRADRYIGDQGYLKFFRGGHLPVFSVSVSDVKVVLEVTPAPTLTPTLPYL
jgi:hypothetical protein